MENEKRYYSANVQRVLKQAGLDVNEVCIDPISLTALQEYLDGNDIVWTVPKHAGASVDDNYNSSFQAKAGVDAAATAVPFFHGRITTPDQFNPTYPNHVKQDDRVLSSTKSAADGTNNINADNIQERDKRQTFSLEERILDQLQYQTVLIMDLHQQLAQLRARVEDLSMQGRTEISSTTVLANNPSAFPNMKTMTSTAQGQNQHPTTAQLPRLVPDDIVPPPAQIQARDSANGGDNYHHQQQEQQHNAPLPPRGPRGPVAYARERIQRLSKIVRLFVTLRRHHAPNFDLGLIFKVLIMAAILLSRISRGRKTDDALRFYALAVMLVGGLLFHSGLVQYLYFFCLKENYPLRIWHGELVDVDEERQRQLAIPPRGVAPRPQPAQPQPQNHHPGVGEQLGDAEQLAPVAPQWGWRHTLLGGIIPRNDPNQPVGFVLGLLQDIIYFFGSFILSIFPMWRPQPMPLPPAPADGAGIGLHYVVDGGGEAVGIPLVPPPRDAAEAVNEDDDDAEVRR